MAVAGRSSPRIIDCGCGTGSNLAMLREFGDAYGFDLTWNGLALGRQMGRTRIAQASIGAIPFSDQTFDVATSFDVFQCLPDPIERAAIVEMRRILKPGGQILLNVAALDILRGGHSVLSDEVRRYSKGRLRTIVEGAGFHVERLTFLNASLFPLMLPVRLWQRFTSGEQLPPGESDITVPAAPVNAALSGLLAIESTLLGIADMPIGSSILCRARKPA
jgi:ubiquinone/menaquinone biosynthesis C-methylase UbiE